MDLDARIRAIVAEVFKLDAAQITDASAPDNVVGWDSIGHLTLIDALEVQLGLTFEEGDISAMENFARIREAVARRMPA